MLLSEILNHVCANQFIEIDIATTGEVIYSGILEDIDYTALKYSDYKILAYCIYTKGYDNKLYISIV